MSYKRNNSKGMHEVLQVGTVSIMSTKMCDRPIRAGFKGNNIA